MKQNIVLSPAQRQAADALVRAIATSSVLVLETDSGMGRSTILKAVLDSAGGLFLEFRQFLDVLAKHDPAAIEESFLEWMEQAIDAHDLVIVDDLHLIMRVVDGCYYPRSALLHGVLTALLDGAIARGKTLLFAVEGEAPAPVLHRAYKCAMSDLTPADYGHICGVYTRATSLDYAQIHRFAPVLNAWQLKNVCLGVGPNPGTDEFIGYLRDQNITSNVNLAEVRPVDWNDLKGVDDVIEALEAKVALPLENRELAARLHLKPRRGVLLAGPPGTGKTTIGRALAHRLKGKFFLIDGTQIAGSHYFYSNVKEIFEAAARNAPSVVFIDDTDLIFEGDENKSFYRYLLTVLDGLESASAERVCVMMTAMNVNSLPAALLRSGRLELWLETRLPDTDARAAIIGACLAGLPPPFRDADVTLLASASHSMTGSDVKSVVEDGKLLLAYDQATGKMLRPVDEYFLEAIGTVRANRKNYAKRKPAAFMEEVRLGFVEATARNNQARRFR